MDISKFTFSHKGKTLNAYIGSAPGCGKESEYIRYFISNNITTIIRCCNDSEIKYSDELFNNNGLVIKKMGINDGSVPGNDVTKELDDLYKNLFSKNEQVNVFFHCVSGLGRAPTHTAYIVCKHMKTDPADFITTIRKKRSGSINKIQLDWIMDLTQFSGGCIIC